MNDSKDHKAAAEPPLDCDVVPDWVGAFLNRRAAVEQTLLNCAAGRQPLPTADMCRDLALRLGVPDEYRAPRQSSQQEEATDEMIDAACAAVPDMYRVDAARAIEAALAVRNMAAMNEQLREVLEWRMCSDPWPGGDMATVDGWLDSMSQAFGFVHWVDAYHGLHK